MKTLIALTALLASVFASAAAPIELAISAEGSGTATIAGIADSVSKANIVLKRDGTFALGLVGYRDSRMSGKWQANGDNVLLRVTEAGDRDASGNGTIELQLRRDGRHEVEWIDASAVTEKGVPYRFRFSVNRPVARPQPLQPAALLMKSTRGGRGVFRAAGSRDRGLTHAHIELFPNGRATVNVYGDVPLGYAGSWKNAGPGVKILNVTGGIAGETVDGAVRLDVEHGTFTRLELSGTHRRVYYSIEFDAYRR